VRPALLLLLGGVGAVLLGGPCGAAGAAPAGPAGQEAEALALLAAAAQAVQERSWSGTEYVSSWQAGAVSSAVLDVRHRGRGATTVRATPTSARAPRPGVDLPEAASDERLLTLLAGHFALAVSGRSTCAGRTTSVVEARREDGQVAGRFWLDRDTALPLRREVYDTSGRLLRSSAYVDVSVAGGPRTRIPATAPAARVALADHAAQADESQAEQPQADRPSPGTAPPELPGGFTRLGLLPHTGVPVSSEAYSDGLSTLTVSRQPGGLDPEQREGYLPQPVGEGTVWVRPGTPEQVVWSGAGEVWTAVSDAGPEATLLAVAALPHDPEPEDGLRARLGRGLARIGSWLDPSG